MSLITIDHNHNMDTETRFVSFGSSINGPTITQYVQSYKGNLVARFIVREYTYIIINVKNLMKYK